MSLRRKWIMMGHQHVTPCDSKFLLSLSYNYKCSMNKGTILTIASCCVELCSPHVEKWCTCIKCMCFCIVTVNWPWPFSDSAKHVTRFRLCDKNWIRLSLLPQCSLPVGFVKWNQLTSLKSDLRNSESRQKVWDTTCWLCHIHRNIPDVWLMLRNFHWFMSCKSTLHLTF